MKKVNFRASWKFALAFAMLLQATIVPSHAAEVTSVEGGNSTKTVYYGLNDMDITITNEKMPTDDGTNVNTLIEGGNSGKYGDLFNESYGRDFEYSWTVTENHVIPVTLHFDMKQAVTLSEAIVYNAKDNTTAGSNGFVTKGQFTVKYEGMEEEVLPEITLTTEQIVPGAFFQVNLDPSKKVEKIDFTVLESTGINCMTLSEVEFNYIDATVINPEGDSDVLGIAASSYAPGDSADTLIKLLDNDSSSYFESNYNNGSLPQWVTFDLGGVYDLTDVDILARQSGTNGQVTGAEIWTSLDNSEFADNYTVEGAYTFATGADGKLTDAANYKNMHFNTVKARYVRVHITAVSATSDFFSLSEVRFYGVANKEELNAALTEAGKITDTTGYTAESVKTFTDAKAEANRVKDDSTVKAKAVAKATSDLTNAIAGLTVDKAALQKAYNDNKDKAEADYTAETWAPFKTALDAAKTVLDKADATVEEVANAKTALEAAVGNLVEKTPDPVVVDKTALQTVYNANKDKVEADYTAETWAPFKTVLDAAKAVLDKADATAEEVANAKTALEAAASALVEKTPEQPEDPKDTVLVDKDNNITVEAKPGVIDENTILKVESIKDFNTLTPAANKVLSSIRGKVNAFDISLLKSNVTVQPNGEITITILIPKDMDPTKVLLYHIADDGTMTTPDTVTYFNGYLKFTTDHLSVYALVEYSNPIDNNPDTDPKPVDPEKPVVPTPEKPSTTDKKSDILANTAAEDTSSNMYVVFMMLCTGAYLGLKAKRKEA